MHDSLKEEASNPTELLDLVDENDQIIGQIEREIANSNPSKIHREIGIVLMRHTKGEDPTFLWQKRSMHKTVHPGKWSITAGHVPLGEDPEHTAHTELQEELGFDTNLVFLTKRLNRYEAETHFMYYYLGLYEGQSITIQQVELEKTAFFTLEQLQQMIQDGIDVNTTHFSVLEDIIEGRYENQIERIRHADS